MLGFLEEYGRVQNIGERNKIEHYKQRLMGISDGKQKWWEGWGENIIRSLRISVQIPRTYFKKLSAECWRDVWIVMSTYCFAEDLVWLTAPPCWLTIIQFQHLLTSDRTVHTGHHVLDVRGQSKETEGTKRWDESLTSTEEIVYFHGKGESSRRKEATIISCLLTSTSMLCYIHAHIQTK